MVIFAICTVLGSTYAGAVTRQQQQNLIDQPWLAISLCDIGWAEITTPAGDHVVAYFPGNHGTPPTSEFLTVSARSMTEVPRGETVFFNGLGEFARGSTAVSGTVTLEDEFTCKMPLPSTKFVWAFPAHMQKIGTHTVSGKTYTFWSGVSLSHDQIRLLILDALKGQGRVVESDGELSLSLQSDWDFTFQEPAKNGLLFSSLGLKAGQARFTFKELLHPGYEIVVKTTEADGSARQSRLVVWTYRGKLHVIFPEKQD